MILDLYDELFRIDSRLASTNLRVGFAAASRCMRYAAVYLALRDNPSGWGSVYPHTTFPNDWRYSMRSLCRVYAVALILIMLAFTPALLHAQTDTARAN